MNDFGQETPAHTDDTKPMKQGQGLHVAEESLQWFSPHGELPLTARIALVDGLATRTFSTFREVIPAGGSSDMQRHYHEGVHVIISGQGYSEIGDDLIDWKAGDFLYTPPWVWHRHYNASEEEPVHMLGITNSPLLNTLGGINRRQSLGLFTMEQVRARPGGVAADPEGHEEEAHS